MTDTKLDVKVELDKLRAMYTKDIAGGTTNICLLGDLGVGKTSILSTARMPVLVHSFDPGGCKLHHLQPLIKEGKIIVDSRFEKEDGKKPTAYKEWESEFERLRMGNVFSGLGTYVIDSFTTWLAALKNEIVKRKGRSEGVLQLQDWQVIMNVVIDMTKLCTALPCDFILTGHLSLEKDEVSGRMLARFKSIPSLQIDVPLLFDEIWVMLSEEVKNGTERRILTQSTGKYTARTRIGSQVFEMYEEADIKKMLKKAGLSDADAK